MDSTKPLSSLVCLYVCVYVCVCMYVCACVVVCHCVCLCVLYVSYDEENGLKQAIELSGVCASVCAFHCVCITMYVDMFVS